MDLETVDVLLKALGLIAVFIAIFQLIEVKKKRLIDMYWKIAEIYSSDEQRIARKSIWVLEKNYLNQKKKIIGSDEELIRHYNSDYHNATDEENQKIDASIMHRLRFLNQIGVLLRRGLIDKDMLFGLIGVGFEVDYSTMKFVLKAHRTEHNIPHMYSELYRFRFKMSLFSVLVT